MSELIGEVKTAITQVQSDKDAKGLPPLKSVDLNLVGEEEGDTSGGFKFLIFDFSRKYTKSSASEVSLTLTPPPPGGAAPVSISPVSKTLKEAILATARAVKKAEAQPPQLVMSNLKASIKFGVKREGNNGLKFEFSPVTLEGGYNTATGITQEIVITYGK